MEKHVVRKITEGTELDPEMEISGRQDSAQFQQEFVVVVVVLKLKQQQL